MSVVVILLMFLAVIAMVKKIDEDRQPSAIPATVSREAERQNSTDASPLYCTPFQNIVETSDPEPSIAIGLQEQTMLARCIRIAIFS